VFAVSLAVKALRDRLGKRLLIHVPVEHIVGVTAARLHDSMLRDTGADQIARRGPSRAASLISPNPGYGLPCAILARMATSSARSASISLACSRVRRSSA